MSFLLENSAHTQDLQSLVTSWNTKREQHDLLLICHSGHRLSTRQSLISLHSPLIRTLLNTIPPSGCIPAISVSADAMDVSGLICLLSTGNTSAGSRDELEEVIKAAGFLGIGLINYKIEDNTSRKTPGVGSNHNLSISPIIDAVKKIVKETLSQEESVVSNCAPVEIENPKKMGIISFATDIFKTTKVKGMSKDEYVSASKKIDYIIEKFEIKPYKYEVCVKQFAQKANLKTYVNKSSPDKHWTEKTYKCKHCEKQFSQKGNMKTHVNKFHADAQHVIIGIQAPLDISIDLAKIIGTNKGEQVSRPQVVKKLLAYLKEKNLQDPENKQWFNPDKTMQPVFGKEKIKCFSISKYLKKHLTNPDSLKENMKSHMNKFHTDSDLTEKPYKCIVCEKHFAQEGNMKAHMKLNARHVIAGIHAPLDISIDLAQIIGTDKGEQVSRPQVLKKLCAYMKEKNLQDPKNKQWFTPDKTMQPVFGKEKIKCVNIGKYKYLKEHLINPIKQ